MVAKPRATKDSWQRSSEFFEQEANHWKALYQAERDRVNRLRGAYMQLTSNYCMYIAERFGSREENEQWDRNLLPGDLTDNSSSETRHLTIPADPDYAKKR